MTHAYADGITADRDRELTDVFQAVFDRSDVERLGEDGLVAEAKRRAVMSGWRRFGDHRIETFKVVSWSPTVVSIGVGREPAPKFPTVPLLDTDPIGSIVGSRNLRRTGRRFGGAE